MEYGRLGKSSVTVSRIGFGCEQLGGTDWGTYDIREVEAAVNSAWDAGVTLYDVADAYGLGRAEESLGTTLGARRHEAVIVTKGGVRWETEARSGRAKTVRDCSRQHLETAVDASLRRLKLECIPLYLVHWPDGRTPLEDTLEALERAQGAGKIRFFGLSNFGAADVQRAAERSELSAVEFPYSLVDREAENALLPMTRKLDLGVLTYGPLAQGLLTGKYGPESRFGPGDRRHRLACFRPEAWPHNAAMLAGIRDVARTVERSIPQVAIRWALDEPGVSTVVVGCKTRSQVIEAVSALGWRLPLQLRSQLGSCRQRGGQGRLLREGIQ